MPENLIADPSFKSVNTSKSGDFCDINVLSLMSENALFSPDISLARERLDWEPKICVEDGLRKTIESFK